MEVDEKTLREEIVEALGAQRHKEKVRIALLGVATTLGIVAMSLSVELISRLRVDKSTASLSVTVGATDRERIQRNFESMEFKLRQIEQRTAAIVSPQPEGELAVRVADLQAGVEDLRKGLKRIENAVLTDPMRAVELPLMRKDIEHLKESQQSAVAALKESMDRSLTMIMWALGLVAAGIVGVAFSGFAPGFARKGTKSSSVD